MDKNLIKEVIIDQHGVRVADATVERELFPHARKLIGSKQIVIISGLRRCGKSTLLRQIRDVDNGGPFYLNFDDDRLSAFSSDDFQTLLEIFIELYGEHKSVYFDEIQNIKGWERFARRLNDDGYTLFITGSNAAMLSRELGTRLTGRHVRLELFPFSFSEFSAFRHIAIPAKNGLTTAAKAKLTRAFDDYLRCGGIPEHVRTGDRQYLHYLYEGILYRDIIGRYALTREKALKELARYLASNIAKEMSYNSLAKLLGLGSTNTVAEYCGYMENTYLLFLLQRYNISLKKQIQFPKKTYVIDTALAESIGFRWSEDRGRMLENAVCMHLRRIGKEIFFHRESKECDFLVREGTRIVQAIQVTQTMSDPNTRTRELDGLANAMVAYRLKEGLIITEHEESTEHISLDGKKHTVRIVPAWKWMLP